jgi:sulfite reductase (NADPH) flavoprotein alpha-component
VILGCACVGVDDDSQHPVSRGCVYICGDATHMAKDVDKVLCRILVECAGLSEDRANDHLRMMEKSERYMLDVW